MLKNTFLDFYNNYVVLRPALPDALVGTPGMGEAVDAPPRCLAPGLWDAKLCSSNELKSKYLTTRDRY